MLLIMAEPYGDIFTLHMNDYEYNEQIYTHPLMTDTET